MLETVEVDSLKIVRYVDLKAGVYFRVWVLTPIKARALLTAASA